MKRGDIVLVQVPFVGAPGTKLRPALVVQSDRLNAQLRETLIAAITSNLSNAQMSSRLAIDISTHEGGKSGLMMNSVVRCERLHVIPQADILRVIGHLPSSLMAQVEACLRSVLDIP